MKTMLEQGSQGQNAMPAEGGDGAMLQKMLQMRAMMDEMIAMMGGDADQAGREQRAAQAGFASVDGGG